MSIVEWRWSTGEEYLKSPRRVYVKNDEVEQIPNTSEQAIHQSLNGYQNEITTFDTFGFDTTFSRSENSSGTRREDLDNKISDRELVFQRGTNPFLQTTNYVDHVVKQDQFLKPKNTTFEKVKQEENNEYLME